LADDHPLFLEGLAGLLVARGFDVVGTAADGIEAIAKARDLRPDLILMDICMPRCDGLAATKLIKAEIPQIKIVMLTMAEENEQLFEAIKCGASGYLLKSLEAGRFVDLLLGLANGEAPFAPGLSERVLGELRRLAVDQGHDTAPEGGGHNGLTPHQLQILGLVARGLTYREVGSVLSLSERTIKYHMRVILDQLRLENRSQAVAWAKRAGLAMANLEVH